MQRQREDYYELVDKIKHLPILDIFNQYVGGKLRHRGNRAAAQCPWHGSDSSPSLTLYTNQAIDDWCCYGCHRGGTNIDLVMAALGIDFKAAVNIIARDFGLSDSQPDPQVRQKLKAVKDNRSAALALEADLVDMFAKLVTMRTEYDHALQTFFDYECNPDLVHERSMLEFVINLIADAREDDEKLRAWRTARKVFPCMKK